MDEHVHCLKPDKFSPSPSHLPGCIPAGFSGTESATQRHATGKALAGSLFEGQNTPMTQSPC